MVTSTPIVSGRPAEHLVDETPQIGNSQVPLYSQGLFIHPEPSEDLFEEGFENSLQVAASEFKKLWEQKVAKCKGGNSSNASLVF